MDCYEKEGEIGIDSHSEHFTWEQMNLLISQLGDWLEYIGNGNLICMNRNRVNTVDTPFLVHSHFSNKVGIFSSDMDC